MIKKVGESVEKYFNSISSISAVIVGALTYLLGGWDILIIALLILMVLDYISGILKGLYTKKLSSQIGFKGILKKIFILIIVSLSVICEKLGVPAIREITIVFFAVNEGLSILENATEMGLPIPEAIKDTLLQIRETKGGQ